MKRIKIALTCLTFALALTGVVVAKANEKKRATYQVAYVSSSGSAYSVTLQGFDFTDAGATSTNQARIVNGTTNAKLIWGDQAFTTRVIHTIP